ncbi:LA2681 family HEPN domain-containing protein [Oxalobacter aliiformigenes]|uniref:LA2681 family HEPN domain-containing protein n=1 Tax=Oxalobacter aliiformigenes TaxID=2946593 RepID=UPI0022B0202C|nr:LA2681 family HEPN domain-containing protein [Oxalobacter aliiformigenes]MCZ4065815.1 LA2681 family HEPN domain-containing protein [Oxalobacter aliiformigenes]WAW00308.1 LA2681 family HEPN domain-containing protein [Oxalobacter aliiformigenes]
MTKNTTSVQTGKTATSSLATLLKKRPARDANALLADIAALTKLAGHAKNPGVAEKVLSWCETAAKRKLDATQRCLLDFYTANAWICRHHERKNASNAAWEQPEIEKAIYHLRKAVDDPAFLFFDELLRCRILTLSGNQHGYMGDFIHAIEYWDRAIETDTRFGMALGNRGKGIAEYAELIGDDTLKPVFLGMATDNLEAATDDDARYFGDEQGKEYFRAELEKIDATLSGSDSDAAPVCGTPRQTDKPGKNRNFRKWCLTEKLYLNPYNDLCQANAAAYDIMEQPVSNPSPLHIMPPAIRFLSQIRQEYIAARHLCHEALSSKVLRDARKSENAETDRKGWSLAVETLKLACRSAWSLLPKIARTVNLYFDLKLPDGKTGLKTVWYKNGNPAEGLADAFAGSTNWPLRGLFWLSKALPPERLSPSTDPHSLLLKAIAEELGHRYLRIVELDLPSGQIVDGTLSRRKLEDATLKALVLARGAIVYLTQAISIEETRKKIQAESHAGGNVYPDIPASPAGETP